MGARYIYTFVPYDRWSSDWLGVELTATFGFRRNHFDRLTHLAFGLLLALPTRELVVRLIRPARGFAGLVAFAFVVLFATTYEMGEWIAAMTLAPDWADRYLGQQGDPWDAHWDTGLAATGAAVVLTLASVRDAARAR